MALTYRSVKGSALTIDELDNNFRHFTGSHAITGSLTISADLTVEGSVVSLAALPTVDPAVAGQLWNDAGTLKVSL
jgi:hypothetical protein|tara:strand:- start:5302 stop:5529 length:228 start_codon:yes stop_codon:yes gene_type:complete